jgi:predicted membrane-bound mannosyltransferase
MATDLSTLPAPSFSAPAMRQDRATAATATRAGISFESAAYLTILLVAFVTRFWDLGARALHHDESLHSYYSWLYATGAGYVHDSMMHGPFLFHANALIYLVFGATDATSRYMPALFGVALVGLPYLLRGPRLFGRWGALLASLFLLISPSILYYSRFIRHDIYTATGSLLLFICIVRYLEQPARRWLVIGGITTGFLFSNHEICYAIFAIFLAFLYVAYLRERVTHAPGSTWRFAAPLIGIHLIAAFSALALLVLLPKENRSRIMAIPWDVTGSDAPQPTGANQMHYYKGLITDPLVIGLLLIAVALVAGVIWLLSRTPREVETPAGPVVNSVRHAWNDPNGLAAAVGAGLAIAVALFTSLFSNFLNGLATATFATNGTLLYWLGQHDVRRGAEPWFYFLVLMPQYELIGFFIGGVAAAIIVVKALLALRPGHADQMPSLMRLLLVAWFAGMFAVLSWAGEKMPWLVIHLALPAILLAALILGDAIARLRAGATAGRLFTWSTAGWMLALLTIGGGWFFAVGRYTRPHFVQSATGVWSRTADSSTVGDWWRVVLPPALIVALLLGLWFRLGPRRAGTIALTSLMVGLVLLQIHLAWRVTYLTGDVPEEMLIYNTTSPDVTRIVSEIGQLSEQLTGTKGIEVWYNSCSAWPLYWYLRDFPNSHPFGSSLPTPAPDPPIILASETSECPSLAEQLPGYTRQEYVLRWAVPEDTTYRNFAIAPELQPGESAWKNASDPHGPFAVLRSIASSFATLGTVQGQQKVYRLWMYKELPSPTWNYPVTLYVRNDLLPTFNEIRY